MNDISEHDIDNMVDQEIQAKQEFERMTPQERYIEALEAQERALVMLLNSVRKHLEEERNRKLSTGAF
jgi:hypothetical protein